MKMNLWKIGSNTYVLQFMNDKLTSIEITSDDLLELQKLIYVKTATRVADNLTLARKKAIDILESISSYMSERGLVKEEVFDCDEKKGTSTWFDLEDIIADIISREGKQAGEPQTSKTPREDSQWEDDLQSIINGYKEGWFEHDPLDGDEVDFLCKLIKSKINLMEGNITEEEYMKETRGEV